MCSSYKRDWWLVKHLFDPKWNTFDEKPLEVQSTGLLLVPLCPIAKLPSNQGQWEQVQANADDYSCRTQPWMIIMPFAFTFPPHGPRTHFTKQTPLRPKVSIFNMIACLVLESASSVPWATCSLPFSLSSAQLSFAKCFMRNSFLCTILFVEVWTASHVGVKCAPCSVHESPLIRKCAFPAIWSYNPSSKARKIC